MSDSSRGSCLCGAVQFSMLWPSKWVAHCHCSLCQRAHGAAFVTWVGVQADKVSIVDSKNTLRWFASSAEALRGFCNECGSTVFFKSSRWADELHITRANFTDALDRDPQVHAFYDSHARWNMTPEDGLIRKVDPGSL